MSLSARSAVIAVAASVALAIALLQPQPASANPLDTACGIVGTIGEGWWGKACKVIAHPGKLVGVVRKVATGKPGQGVKVLLGGAGKNALSAQGALGIAAIVAWAVGGAHFVLSETAKLVGQSTSPELTAAWFSSVYLRVAGVATLLTLPFLFAAAIQAVLRADGTLLARAVFGYLPLSFLATGVAAPMAMMLLRLTDWMGASVTRAAGDQGSHFLVESGVAIGALGVAIGSPFVTFLIALLTAAAGLVLWLELLIREAAVYVVVLMLPLVFAAMVWPARRIWAIRSVEILVALILAKFAIVSVLALAAAALGHDGGSLIVRSLAGLVLVVLGAFAPWVLVQLLPLAEVASAATGHVREHAQGRLASDAAIGRHGVATVSDGVSALIDRIQSFQPDIREVTNGRHPEEDVTGGAVVAMPGAPGGDRGGIGASGSSAAAGETGAVPGSTSSSAPSQPSTGSRGAQAPTQAPTDVAGDRPQQGGRAVMPPDDVIVRPPEIQSSAGHDDPQPKLPLAESDEGETR